MWTKNAEIFELLNRSWPRAIVVWQLNFALLVAPCLLSGCAASRNQWEKTVHNDTCEVDRITAELDNPSPQVINQVSMTSEPVTALTLSESEVTYLDMGLSDVLQQAMQHSTILRDIGGIVLRSPDTVNTGFATQLQETDPRFGMEAALSAFDAQLAASANFNNNNRIFNNSFFSGGATAFNQDLHDYQVELSKRSATGSLMAIRSVTGYDSNNAPANTFPSAWDTWLEGEIRQPLLQGGGLEFNRIAGPGATPGVYNGLLIAKSNSDINHSEFIASLRGFVSNVENAYWDLYAAYRELDARKKAMEKSLVLWNEARAKGEGGTTPKADEALARQQYYQFKAEVDEALSGRLLQGTQTLNGSGGGTMQVSGGVLTAERRLRLLTGMTAADGQLLRTIEEPTMAPIHFDWHSAMTEAVRQRPELKRQNVVVKKKEMELLASRNFLNPRLDAVGRYRWRGFGDDLIGGGTQTGTSPRSAVGNLATGDQQEWTLGVELTIPIGYRKAHAGVQHAEIALSRARAIQKEQQREVISDLNGAIADAVRAYQSVENNLNQYLAAKEYVEALEQRKALDMSDGTDRVLDAQRRLLQSEIQFFRARAEYAVTLKNVHYEKGSLLRYKDLRVAGVSNFHDDEYYQDDYSTQPVEELAPEIYESDMIPTDSQVSLPPSEVSVTPQTENYATPSVVTPTTTDHSAMPAIPELPEPQAELAVSKTVPPNVPKTTAAVSTFELAEMMDDRFDSNGSPSRPSNRSQTVDVVPPAAVLPAISGRVMPASRPVSESGWSASRAGGGKGNSAITSPQRAVKPNHYSPLASNSGPRIKSVSATRPKSDSSGTPTPTTTPIGGMTQLSQAGTISNGTVTPIPGSDEGPMTPINAQ